MRTGFVGHFAQTNNRIGIQIDPVQVEHIAGSLLLLSAAATQTAQQQHAPRIVQSGGSEITGCNRLFQIGMRPRACMQIEPVQQAVVRIPTIPPVRHDTPVSGIEQTVVMQYAFISGNTVARPLSAVDMINKHPVFDSIISQQGIVCRIINQMTAIRQSAFRRTDHRFATSAKDIINKQRIAQSQIDPVVNGIDRHRRNSFGTDCKFGSRSPFQMTVQLPHAIAYPRGMPVCIIHPTIVGMLCQLPVAKSLVPTVPDPNIFYHHRSDIGSMELRVIVRPEQE